MSDREGYLQRRDQLLMQDEEIAELKAELAALKEGIKEHSQCFNSHEGDPHDLALWALLQEKGE